MLHQAFPRTLGCFRYLLFIGFSFSLTPWAASLMDPASGGQDLTDLLATVGRPGGGDLSGYHGAQVVQALQVSPSDSSVPAGSDVHGRSCPRFGQQPLKRSRWAGPLAGLECRGGLCRGQGLSEAPRRARGPRAVTHRTLPAARVRTGAELLALGWHCASVV